MANYSVNLSNGVASISGVVTYYSWSDFISFVNSNRSGNTFELHCQHSTDTEFKLIQESDESWALQRKNYVNDLFVGYVTVESGMNSIQAIDRLDLIYANGSEWHQSQVQALSISNVALWSCI